jgi:diguanylate cyclase (GGDEF)-like protein/PAS domain S-box-containing protein
MPTGRVPVGERARWAAPVDAPPPPTAFETTPFAAAELDPHLRDALGLYAQLQSGALMLVEQHGDSPACCRWINDAATRILSWDSEDIHGRPLTALLAEGATLPDFLTDRQILTELVLRRADGVPAPVVTIAVPLGLHTGVRVWALSLQEAVLAEEGDLSLLRRPPTDDEARFRDLADQAPIGMVRGEGGVRIDYANDAMVALSGLPEARLLGTGWLALFDDDTRGGLVDAIAAVLAGDEQRLDAAFTNALGVQLRVSVSLVPVQVEARPAGFVATVEDVTEHHRQRQALEDRTLTDELTGLGNRARLSMFMKDLADGEPMPDTHRSGSPERAGDSPASCDLGLLFIDLDGFGALNETHGHVTGDALLRESGIRMSTCVRDGDFVVRLGGDEFVVVLRNAGGERAACAVADRILASLRQPIVIAGTRINVSASIGVSTTDRIEDVKTLLPRADLAMYAAKRGGRGRIETYSSQLDAHAERELTLEDELRITLRDGGLGMAFQPVFSLGRSVSGPRRKGDPPVPTIVGIEALARWNSPVHGTVQPDEFVAVAERTGLVTELGRQMLFGATARLAEWRQRLGVRAPAWVAVNASAAELLDVDFPAQVAEALNHAGLPGNALLVEITETTLLADRARATAQIAALRELGVRIALDDFGSGYCSLGLLADLEVDVIKLDRELINGLSTARGRAVTRAILQLAEELEVDVIAEGVETESQLEILRRDRCRLVQGWLFAKAMPAADVEETFAVAAADAAAHASDAHDVRRQAS